MKDFGVDIVTVKSSPNKYFVHKRYFEISELKLLIDAVQSSKFITQDKSQLLINKITKLGSRKQAEQLKRNLYIMDRIKSTNENIYEFIDIINSAINQNKKINSKYFDYTSEKKKILKNKGELYKLTPYSLIWNADYYYVVGFSEKHNKIVQFRVDRIYNPKISIEKGIEKPWDFNVGEYTNKAFQMYNGEIITVELLCDNSLMKTIIDRFGENVETKKNGYDSFIAKVDISDSPTFYGWIFQFSGKIKILSPQKTKDNFINLLNVEKEQE